MVPSSSQSEWIGDFLSLVEIVEASGWREHLRDLVSEAKI